MTNPSIVRNDAEGSGTLKLHHVVDFPGFRTRVIVISFLPEFVYSLGSPSHDYAFLLPFFAKLEKRPHVLQGSDKLAPDVCVALVRMLECRLYGRELLRQAVPAILWTDTA